MDLWLTRFCSFYSDTEAVLISHKSNSSGLQGLSELALCPDIRLAFALLEECNSETSDVGSLRKLILRPAEECSGGPDLCPNKIRNRFLH